MTFIGATYIVARRPPERRPTGTPHARANIRKTPDNEDINRLKRHTYGSELVMGDLNLNRNVEGDKKLLKRLCDDGKTNHLDDVTTDKLNQLDYVLLDEKIVKEAFSTAYKNFIADHKTITVRIPYIGNEFSEEFKSKQYFDVDHHLKPDKKKKAASSKNTLSAKPLAKAPPNMELSSLDSPNWIRDDLIDQYLELITNQFTDFFSTSINFFTCLKKEGYESVEDWYEGRSLFTHKMLFFPIYDHNHYYLIVYDNIHQKLEAYDPYDVGFNNMELQAEFMTENVRYLEAALSFLIDNYLKPKYEAFYEGIMFAAKSIIYTPPLIPSQVNDSDCGVYLLQFAKHIVQNKNFEFNSAHIDGFREEMKLELFFTKLRPVKYIENNIMKSSEEKSFQPTKQNKNSAKPKSTVEKSTQPTKLTKNVKPTKMRMITQRRFDNKSLEDCWMNSTLQLILTGMDHLQECVNHGSSLWKALILMKNEDKQKALNPLPVKELVVSKENQRIRDEQLIVNYNLQIGQQDAKDFFYLLTTKSNSLAGCF